MQDGTLINVYVCLMIASKAQKEYSSLWRVFSSGKSLFDRSFLGTSKALPVRVVMLTTLTHEYFR